MQTPEEFEWTLYQAMDHQMDAWKNVERVHELIRARDEEVRARSIKGIRARIEQLASWWQTIPGKGGYEIACKDHAQHLRVVLDQTSKGETDA